jgi:hypothetical protein
MTHSCHRRSSVLAPVAARWLLGIAPLIGFLLAVLSVQPLSGQQVLTHGFEGRELFWVKGRADAPFKEVAHRLTDETAYSGSRSETIQLIAEPGNFIHYTSDVGRAPVVDELNVSLLVKANRPGTQLLCRIVLPGEHDPHNLDQPLTLIVKGDAYKTTGQWQQLALRQPVKRLKEQQQLLRAELKRDVVIADAYVDRVILNLYSGPGQTDVWTDDLEVGPLLEKRPVQAPTPHNDRESSGQLTSRTHNADAVLKENHLFAGGEKMFMLGIRHSGTPLKTLRDARFNTLFADENSPPGLIEDAATLGFWLVPLLTPPTQIGREGVPADGGQLVSTEAFRDKLSRYLDNDRFLCLHLGSNLTSEQFPAVQRIAQAYRSADPMRPLLADVWDGYKSYSRNIDGANLMLGIHRWPLMTTLELAGYRDWLQQRRLLAVPDTYCWTWIQTHLPDWYTDLVYGKTSNGPFDEPIGPQAEQIRLLTYTALGCGYRGLGFWSDRFLADSHTGRDRLLALALLNQEIEMLEPLLVSAEEPRWIPTARPEVQAAVLRTKKATLVLPVWLGSNSQFVPGQAASAQLSITVPQVPQGCQPWEVSPGQLRSLRWERVLGGVKVTLNEFDLTAAIVFTSDLSESGPIVRLQETYRRMLPMAAQWAHDQAKEEMAKVEKIEKELEQMGHRPPDAQPLLDKAHAYLEDADKQKADGNQSERYADALRALRPLRILMRAQWELAVKPLDTPVASPYTLGFWTLPQHWRFWQRIEETKAAANMLDNGDFELPPAEVPKGWVVRETPSLDAVVPLVRRVATEPHSGKQCLMLKLSPKNAAAPPLALERTYLSVQSPAVALPPGTLVRITAWARLPGNLAGSVDGAMLFDSVGGEALAVRLVTSTKWHRYTFYREVPASGQVSVTMALTGMGEVYFDDVKIEPLVGRNSPLPPARTTTAKR